MSHAAIYEISVGSVDAVSVDWSDWMETLPSGQTLDSVAAAFDGSAGGLVLDHSAVVGNVSTHYINASGGSVVSGFIYLKLTATSGAILPVPDYMAVRYVLVKVIPKIFVEDIDA
jgi:hypothetical protein